MPRTPPKYDPDAIRKSAKEFVAEVMANEGGSVDPKDLVGLLEVLLGAIHDQGQRIERSLAEVLPGQMSQSTTAEIHERLDDLATRITELAGNLSPSKALEHTISVYSPIDPDEIADKVGKFLTNVMPKVQVFDPVEMVGLAASTAPDLERSVNDYLNDAIYWPGTEFRVGDVDPVANHFTVQIWDSITAGTFVARTIPVRSWQTHVDRLVRYHQIRVESMTPTVPIGEYE
jgi:hypothetical protein